MIGRRCKARERLSRAPLIGRALRDHLKAPSAPDRSQGHFFLKRCAAPRAPCGRHPPHQQPAPQRPPGAGGSGGRGTPGPIPNPEVKPASADGTAGATLWESRAPPAPGARCAGSGRGGAREAPGRGGPERVPLFVRGVFRLTNTTRLFLLFNRPFLSLMMDNLIFCLRLVARAVGPPTQAGLWGVIRRLVVDNRGNDAHNGRVTKSKHSDEAAHSAVALSFKRRRYEPGH